MWKTQLAGNENRQKDKTKPLSRYWKHMIQLAKKSRMLKSEKYFSMPHDFDIFIILDRYIDQEVSIKIHPLKFLFIYA